MGEKKQALPFEVGRGFTSIPNVIFTHYSFFPKFNGTVIRVYAYLLKMYNAQYGYAFPTQIQAMEDLGISDRTFRNSVDVLVDARLVRVAKNKPYNNNVYYFEAPIEDEAVFFATFPQAADVKRQKGETVERIKTKKDDAERPVSAEKVECGGIDDLLAWM